MSVLGSTDGLLDEGGTLGCLLLGGFLLQELVDGLLVVGLGLAETVDTACQGVIPGLAGTLVLLCHRSLG